MQKRDQDFIDDLLESASREQVIISPALYTRIIADANLAMALRKPIARGYKTPFWSNLLSNMRMPSLPALSGSLLAASLCAALLTTGSNPSGLSAADYEFAAEIWTSEQNAQVADLDIWLTGWSETALFDAI